MYTFSAVGETSAGFQKCKKKSSHETTRARQILIVCMPHVSLILEVCQSDGSHGEGGCTEGLKTGKKNLFERVRYSQGMLSDSESSIQKTDDSDMMLAHGGFLKMQKKIAIMKYSSASDYYTGDSA